MKKVKKPKHLIDFWNKVFYEPDFTPVVREEKEDRFPEFPAGFWDYL